MYSYLSICSSICKNKHCGCVCLSVSLYRVSLIEYICTLMGNKRHLCFYFCVLNSRPQGLGMCVAVTAQSTLSPIQLCMYLCMCVSESMCVRESDILPPPSPHIPPSVPQHEWPLPGYHCYLHLAPSSSSCLRPALSSALHQTGPVRQLKSQCSNTHRAEHEHTHPPWLMSSEKRDGTLFLL